MNDNTQANVAWHFWAIAIIALIWNSGGAFDYVMTQTQNPEYMAAFSQAQLDFFYGFPSWLIALWAMAVWGGVLGSLCLLLRRAIATPIFLVSFIAMAGTFVQNYLFDDGLELIGSTGEMVFVAMIFVIALVLYLYAKAQTASGVLR